MNSSIAAPLKGFRAFDDLVIVERDQPESVSAGGIIIPLVAQEEMDQGTVVCKGPGKRSTVGTVLPMDVKVGDHVLYSKYANLAMKWHGKEYVTMREADLIGVIEA